MRVTNIEEYNPVEP